MFENGEDAVIEESFPLEPLMKLPVPPGPPEPTVTVYAIDAAKGLPEAAK
jgi:hypothetical protein